MTVKITGVTVVLLLASVLALGSGIVVFALGTTPLAAVGTGGVAFLGIAGLGMGVLSYLLPDAPRDR
ncbi:hypothetical protein [Streptomyces marianii]|uniref:Uncharacterized protein n=1 Tax=Streptomyces marianii TaxID=1817406 RepID=A0A5R9DR40_9ACTN|nr:hypothetical protein [Streptomyces marianii]TLQ38956.1 hypothetical protein FEF34_39745 [Streptomyces marianii]